jgi:ABC-type Mn2+/Zn2+ transport system ATPase subunit
MMKAVTNHSGVYFNSLFFDEALDGCDNVVKMKALRLLESLTLEYESVFLVEHSDVISTAVNNKYSVTNHNGNSIVCQL